MLTPLQLDEKLRCVRRDGGEEWFAYSLDEGWFPITAEKAEWILGMVPDIAVEQAMAWCRANGYKDVGYDPETETVLFEKAA
jgi:hypothetical protein